MRNINLQTSENEKQDYRLLAKAARLFPPAGGAFLVGGCVRDLLTGSRPADYDLAVSGKPVEYARRIAQMHGGRPVPIGPSGHKIFRVVAGPRVFDISPLAGSSIGEDLKDRDFTINAMAYDIAEHELIDPENGLEDLGNRILKAVSANAFVNDPLRLLRAFRLGTQFNCKIDGQTFQAIKTSAGLIKNCAGERVRTELLKLLALSGSFDALEQMADCGLLFDIIPELRPLIECRQNTHHSFDVWTHTLASYRSLESLTDHHALDRDDSMIRHAAALLENRKRTGLLKMAMLLHDTGKPATRSTDGKGRIHFYGHGRRGYKIAADICRRLKFSRREMDYIGRVIKNHNRPLFLFLLHTENRLSDKAVTRFFIQCDEVTPDILLHAVADFAGKRRTPSKESKDFAEFAEALLKRYFDIHIRRQAKPGLITGRDLITGFGLAPSPVFKKILAAVEAARLAGEISEKQQAMDLARRLLDRNR
jgi:poly(A) polymerase